MFSRVYAQICQENDANSSEIRSVSKYFMRNRNFREALIPYYLGAALNSNSSMEPPYNVYELIGEGSFGKVYRAQCNRTNSQVAYKVISKVSSTLSSRPAQKLNAISCTR